MFWSCSFCRDAVWIVLVERKVALWFKLSRVCAGVCSVLSNILPKLRPIRKSIPFSCSLVWYVLPLLRGSLGQCSGLHFVLLSIILCRAFDTAWAFGENSIALKAPRSLRARLRRLLSFLPYYTVEPRSE